MVEFIKKIKILKDTVQQIKNWHNPINYYLGTLNKESIIYFKNGIKCIMRNKSDSIAFFENYFLKLNSPNEKFKIKKDDIVIDIGAHIGYFTIFAAKNACQGTIYSIEPYRESFETLKKNLELNDLTNVKPFHAAISKATEQVTLYIDKNNQIGNSIFRTDETTESEKVDSFSLGDFVKNNKIEKIDFLKIDCEGAEFEILLNLDHQILQKIDKIVSEMHPKIENFKIEDVKEFLTSHGFDVKTNYPLNDISEELVMLYAKKLPIC